MQPPMEGELMYDIRQERRVPINILINKYIDGEPHCCRAVNLSRGGILLYKIFEPDVPHSEVSLEFQLPGSSRILRIDGVALSEHPWARAHGVRFVRMSDDDRVLVDRYVRGMPLEQPSAARANPPGIS